MTIEHRPHIGVNYNASSPRIAILGYSHHDEDLSGDHPGGTENCIRDVIAGKPFDTKFFDAIAGYFGDVPAVFWDRVAFFNFLPRAVEREQRYRGGRVDEIREGRKRFDAILDDHAPDRIFVFSRKAWYSCPKTLEEQAGVGQGTVILPDQPFDRHHYRTTYGHIVQAFGLRHPQFAKRDVMTRAVAASMAMEAAPPT